MLRWRYRENDGPSISCDVSLDSLKLYSLHFKIKHDPMYSILRFTEVVKKVSLSNTVIRNELGSMIA